MPRTPDRHRQRLLVYAAFTVSISLLLSYIKIYRLPNGGSISLEALPIIWTGTVFGLRYGISCGFMLGILRMMFGGVAIHPVQPLLDYVLAFSLLGLCGAGRKRGFAVQLAAVIVAFVLRYAVHVVSGIVFFGQYAPEGQPVLVYSMIYNSFVFIEAAVTIAFWTATRTRVEAKLSEYAA